MSWIDSGTGQQVDAGDLTAAPDDYTLTNEQLAAMTRAILRDSREGTTDERVHLVGVLLEVVDQAGLRDSL